MQSTGSSVKNIAFLITSNGWGGLEMNTLKLATQLKQRNHRVILITQDNSTIFLKGRDIFDSVCVVKKRRKYFDFSTAKKIATFLSNEKTDSVMIFDNADIDVAAWAKRLYSRNLRIIYQQHMQIGIKKRDLLHTFRYRAIDCWISPLNYLKKEVARKTRFPEQRIKVIPICLDVKKFTPPKYAKPDALQKLKLAPAAPLLGIIGRIEEGKGQRFLVESVLKLKDAGVNTELLVFGSPTVNDPKARLYYESMVQFVKDNKADNIIHFVDHQQDVSLFYNSVDVFVLATRGETYGMVTIEAMLSQIPVIATSSSGTSELLDFGKYGTLFLQNDFEDFSAKLLHLLKNWSESQSRASLAYSYAIQKFELHNEVSRIDQLLNSR